jgi:hypothetical protein
MTIENTPALRLLGRLDKLAIPYGREDSFKLGRQRLISNRILIGVGVDATRRAADGLLGTAMEELRMPQACLDVLLPHAALANAVFFGVEDLGESCVCKVYLEFWDQVRNTVRRTGSRTPLLLHLGVKWDTARPGRREVAHYHCHPLLDVQSILRRMARLAPQDHMPGLYKASQDIVLLGARRSPSASLLYLEVSEPGNPRQSFDINLYKTGLDVAAVAAPLQQAARCLVVPPEQLDSQLQRLGPCRLGHLSSGLDRHGQPFLTVYAEIH